MSLNLETHSWETLSKKALYDLLHNNANILSIPARFVTTAVAKELVKTFLETPFEGGRHQNRVTKISQCR